MPEGNEGAQFAVLHHLIEDDEVQHLVRVYYHVENQYHYKDLILPGNTMVDAISLENDSLLFSRDPDNYRFRIMQLPKELLLPPHSEQSQPVLLTTGQTGEPARPYHQPKGTDAHVSALAKLYSSKYIPDSIEPYSTETGSAYDATNIRGVQLNEEGTLLAVWTESNSVYIYKRGSGDGLAYERKQSISESPHHLEKPLEWILRMVVTPKEGHLGFVTPIGSVMFWQKEGVNYLSVGMKNNIVNTYLIDEMEEAQQTVSFQTLLKEKWDLWLIMTTVTMLFVVNEYKMYP
ncbi:hypothetical protein EDC96DRAFT_445078 [Choanephora cucurbitarum]|nr:hypothetical protein EDC96DRAFT_445078 [Choanephora cucurbitarum]